jgi:hypothetical protein
MKEKIHEKNNVHTFPKKDGTAKYVSPEVSGRQSLILGRALKLIVRYLNERSPLQFWMPRERTSERALRTENCRRLSGFGLYKQFLLHHLVMR